MRLFQREKNCWRPVYARLRTRYAVWIPLCLLLSLASRERLAQTDQPLEGALTSVRVQSALRSIDAQQDSAAIFLSQIGGIVSPSGKEGDRARVVAARMQAIGLQNVTVDTMPNVVGVIPGRSGKAVVFISTLDDLATVAEQQKAAERPPYIDGTRVVGPGVNTSLVTAAMLTAAEAFIKSGLKPEHDLVFAAVAQEETGLVGMKHLYAAYKDRGIAFVDILGDGQSISYGAIVIHWWKVVGVGPPGHSLGGGLPNVNQGLARAVDRIFQLPDPVQHASQRTVINMAVLNSGAVFNHKPKTGWFSLDIRSMNPEIVVAIEEKVRTILTKVSSETNIALTMEPFQLTPGGQIPGAKDSYLVKTSAAIARYLGIANPRISDLGSSNMNVSIAGGSPSIGIGGERGGQRGFPDEWADRTVLMRTAKHVLLLAATQGGAK